VDDPLVVADLTGINPNVFYELAIRHVIRKPLVQIIQKGEKIPFDVAGMRTIQVDHRDLDSVEDAKADIQRQIKAVEGKAPKDIESPISVSAELQALRQSERPEDRTLAELVSIVAQLRTEIATIGAEFTHPLTGVNLACRLQSIGLCPWGREYETPPEIQRATKHSLKAPGVDRRLDDRKTMAQDIAARAAQELDAQRRAAAQERGALRREIHRLIHDLREASLNRGSKPGGHQIERIEERLKRFMVMLGPG
jgi:hypothetical protein